jgi:hypothetical protein
MAIQLLPGRVDENVRKKHPGYQINFILDDANHSRVGCITFHNEVWVRQVGRDLAEYLKVPLVDQIPVGH